MATSNRTGGQRQLPSARAVWVPRGTNPIESAAPLPPREPPRNPPPRNRHRRRGPGGDNKQQQQAAPTAPEASAGSDSVAPSSAPQLVQEIQDKLSRGAVECMICYDMVRRSAPVWSCDSCFSIFHLHCIRKWARSPTSAADATDSASPDAWRCPGCQSVQSVSSKDLIYTCFCGRIRDPPNDLFLTPHSCGEPCGKQLHKTTLLGVADNEADQCPHVCVLQCHPGPCPPCKAFAPRKPCPCGKTMVTRRCAEQGTLLSCGQQCDRLLSCHRHLCAKLCHTGACGPCMVLLTARCFCGKKAETIHCGEMSLKGELSVEGGVFSCNAECGQLLSCGNHKCEDVCHPGTCRECKLMPRSVTTCHCGKTSLTVPRESCLDPIPTCDKLCDKALPCGTHQCKSMCHEGECPPCLIQIEQRCRCRSSSRMVECYKVWRDREEFVCTKPCGQKKNCGRHRCNERCCPLSRPASAQLEFVDWDPHFCSIPCGKKLRCGQHSCPQLCHSGHCPPCLETIFTDLTCACGKTSLPPPLPCGTPPPSCQHPCLVSQPCGHERTHSCHFGDCPPCIVPVVKECAGGHMMLRNQMCGSKEIRCNQMCGKLRQCGVHACSRACHPLPCDPLPADASADSSIRVSCGQICGAPRRECKHTCTAPCHPSAPCPDLICEFPVTISCTCGRITASVPCGSGGSPGVSSSNADAESTVVQKLPTPLQPVESNGGRVPLGQRKLSCNDECAKLERKKVLAEAFDINTPNLDGLNFVESSEASELLGDLFRREPKWVVSIEERCKFLVLGKTKGASTSTVKVHVFCPMLKEKRDAVRLIAERWKLSIHYAGWEPKRFVMIHVTPKSRSPPRVIGHKAGMPLNPLHPPIFDPLVDMDPRLVVAMFDLPRDADVSALVLRFGGECELVWLNDKNALAVFSDPARAATALRRLDHGSPYVGASSVLSNGSASGILPSNAAWGAGPRDEVLAIRSTTNPRKKAVAPEQESGNVARAVWGGPDPYFSFGSSSNRWNVLERVSLVDTTEASYDYTGPSLDEDSSLEAGLSKLSSVNKLDSAVEVEDWEDACE